MAGRLLYTGAVLDRRELRTGLVVIGRNEGSRLTRCLDSLAEHASRCVYVDSGSTDGSVNEARRRGVEVVELDMSRPFTAARARNTGFRRLMQIVPDMQYVHFFDGDCEIHKLWVGKAQRFMDGRTDIGIVYGVQTERHPERSVYNRLLDIEWDTPRGEVRSSGGLLMCRRPLFEKLNGFREDLIAGEDPEFCLRARQAGALIWHLDEPMAIHDGEMSRFSQWWKRAKRAGYAYAEGARLHGDPPERHFVKERNSILFWALGVPAAILLASLLFSPWALLGFLVYPLQVWRIARRGRRDARINWLYAFFVVLGKFPELSGCLKHYRDHLGNSPRRLIEYK
jgi:GT2 family glycosyltransferase